MKSTHNCVSIAGIVLKKSHLRKADGTSGVVCRISQWVFMFSRRQGKINLYNNVLVVHVLKISFNVLFILTTSL